MRVLAHYALDESARAQLERVSAEIMACFAAGGYRRLALPLLQPADLYLDMAGEDIRERMFVFEDPAGAEICLRADLTIPACRSVIDDAAAALPARLSCLGPIFRFGSGDDLAPTELLQAGIECLGAADPVAADAEVFGLAREALDRARVGPMKIEIGDVALFPALLADLAIDAIWIRRLAYAFRHPSLLRPTLDDLDARVRPPAKTFEVDLVALDTASAERFVRDKLGVSGDELVFGRTVSEIAAHLVDKAKAARAPLPGRAELDVIEAFLTIEDRADDGLARLKGLTTGTAFAEALAHFEEALARARAHARPGDALVLKSTLGRNFIYYTGFVFELTQSGISDPIASGGRYDGLMSDLGSPVPVPAVGCAIWPERVLAAGARDG